MPLHKVGELRVSFDEPRDIRTAGNNLPTPLPRLVQRSADQSDGHSMSSKFVRDERVIQNNVLPFVSVADERKRCVAGLRFKALEFDIVHYRERSGCGRC